MFAWQTQEREKTPEVCPSNYRVHIYGDLIEENDSFSGQLYMWEREAVQMSGRRGWQQRRVWWKKRERKKKKTANWLGDGWVVGGVKRK